jgi:hypothetical protein
MEQRSAEGSMLHQFLIGEYSTELEKYLNLRTSKGLPLGNFRYDKSMWDSWDDYLEFLCSVQDLPTLSGEVQKEDNKYCILIAHYKGRYLHQVEVEDILGRVRPEVNSSSEYGDALIWIKLVLDGKVR